MTAGGGAASSCRWLGCWAAAASQGSRGSPLQPGAAGNTGQISVRVLALWTQKPSSKDPSTSEVFKSSFYCRCMVLRKNKMTTGRLITWIKRRKKKKKPDMKWHNVGKNKKTFVLKTTLNSPTHLADIIATTEAIFVEKWKETGLLMTQK